MPASLPSHARYTSHCQSQTPAPAQKNVILILRPKLLLPLEIYSYISDLFRVKQGTTRHFGPRIIIWNQFVFHQAVNTVCLHYGAFIELVLIWCSCSYRARGHYFSTSAMISPKMWTCVKPKMLTLNVWLSSQDFPEFFSSMAVNAFLNELDVLSPAAQISLTLDKISQLGRLNAMAKRKQIKMSNRCLYKH